MGQRCLTPSRIAALLQLLLTTALIAQPPSPPTACAEVEGFHRLDFWIGSWTVWVGEQQVGINRIEPILGGCAVRERWLGSGSAVGESLFYFLPATGEWKQVWVTALATARGGVKEKGLVEELPGGAVRFQGSIPVPGGGSYSDRTTLTPLSHGRVRQLIEVSTDGSWRSVFDAVYVPQPPPAGGPALATAGEHDRLLGVVSGDDELRAWIVAAGGTPWREVGGVLFLAEGEPERPPRLIGDWNGWGEAGASMSPIAGTRFFWRRVPLRPDARVEYRLTVGDEERLDPFNPSAVAAFSGRSSELAMPSYVQLAELAGPLPERRGRVIRFEHDSAALGNRRAVHVYLPPDYDQGGRRYPTAYLGDGTLYLERLLMAQRLDQRIDRGELESLIAVFVDPVDRRGEYRMNDAFRKMMADELVPRIDRDFRTEPGAARRAVAGASRGGLAALDLALGRPDRFGRALALAPALDPLPLEELFDRAAAAPGRFVIARALYDSGWGVDAERIRRSLEERGARVVYREIPEGHTLATWANHFDALLVELWRME